MKPIDFPQSTKVLQKPSNMLNSECQPLPIWSDGKECVSCWRPTLKERFRILFTGKVWLSVLSGVTQPPVYITGERMFVLPPLFARVRNSVSEMINSTTQIFNALKNALNQRDKQIHLLCGFLISLVVGFFVPWLGFTIGAIAGALKEFWDSKGHGTVETMDFVFTCIGAALAIAPSLILHNLIF
jgi:hypothetical protein